MSSSLFEAASSGNLDQLRFQLDSMAADINSKDDSGTSALMHAIKGSHAEIVQELVARGADRTEAKKFDFPEKDQHLSSIVSDENAAASQKPAQTGVAMYGSAEQIHAVPVQLDAHGGHRLPDGTVSYLHSGGFQQQPNQATYPPPQNYNYDAQQYHGPPGAPNGPSHEEKTPEAEQGQEGQGSKEANLPPPEVARMIPCRFFPNCRYGEKCIFAHPVAVPLGGAEGTSPLPSNAAAGSTSPVDNAATPAAAPVFYQPPPGYGYGQATPYGPPQHFYMGPPMPIQYSHAGVPLPLHFPPPPPHAAHPDQAAVPAEAFSPQAQQAQFSPSHHFQPQMPQHAFHPQQYYPHSMSGPNGEISEQNPAGQNHQSRHDKSPREGTKEEGGDRSGQTDGNGKSEDSGNSPSNGKSSHRRQSFNSFLHHHAIPFQPTATLAMGPISGAPLEGRTSSGYRGKRGRGGSNGYNGNYNGRNFRSSERPPCTFFLKGACNYGEECAFPHYLPDGTDARTPAAIAGETAPHKKANQFFGNGGTSTGVTGSIRGGRGGRGRGSHHHTGSLVHPLPSGPAATSSLPTATAFPNAPAASVAQGNKPQQTATSAEPSSATPVAEAASSSPSNQTSTSAEASKQEAEERSGSTVAPASIKSIPTPQQTASIPAKPVEATNSLKENQEKKDSKESAINPNLNSQSKQNNNSGSDKKASHQKSSTASSAAASGVPAKPRANGSSGRGNSNQNSATRKVAAQSQRIPNVDDFPALGGAKESNTTGGTKSSSSTSSDSTAVNPTPNPPKINFSAILSAPAPVKEVSSVATNTSEEKVDEEKEKKEKEKKEKKERKEANKHQQQAGHLNASSPPVASKKAAPQVDEDGFSIVGAKHGAKSQNQTLNNSSHQNGNGSSFAGVAPSSTVAA